MHTHESLSIWFFIGLLLTLYGVLILGSGLYALWVPPAHPAVLAALHPEIWWGGVLLLIGLIYFIRFYPRKR